MCRACKLFGFNGVRSERLSHPAVSNPSVEVLLSLGDVAERGIERHGPELGAEEHLIEAALFGLALEGLHERIADSLSAVRLVYGDTLRLGHAVSGIGEPRPPGRLAVDLGAGK
jgi:hypothetical protein